MNYFEKDFLDFFKELDQNNIKIWFDKNRKRYEKNVKEPFYELIQELILRMQDEDKELYTEPKEAIFRINNDLRFAKNKSPYKTYVSASLSTGGRKKPDSPGYYIQLSYDKVWVGGGLYHPSKEGLFKIRSYIQNHPEELTNLLEDRKFIEAYGSLQGEKNKKLPLEFASTMKNYPKSCIDYKQFYYIRERSEATSIIQPDFIQSIVSVYKAGLEINKYLRTALKED